MKADGQMVCFQQWKTSGWLSFSVPSSNPALFTGNAGLNRWQHNCVRMFMPRLLLFCKLRLEAHALFLIRCVSSWISLNHGMSSSLYLILHHLCSWLKAAHSQIQFRKAWLYSCCQIRGMWYQTSHRQASLGSIVNMRTDLSGKVSLFQALFFFTAAIDDTDSNSQTHLTPVDKSM